MDEGRRVAMGIARNGLLTIETDFRSALWSVFSLPKPPADRKHAIDRILALCVTTGVDEVAKYIGMPHKACVFAYTDGTYRAVQREAGTVPTNALALLDVIRADPDVQEYFFVLLPETFRTLCRLLSSNGAPVSLRTDVTNVLKLDFDAPFAILGIVDAASRVQTALA